MLRIISFVVLEFACEAIRYYWWRKQIRGDHMITPRGKTITRKEAIKISEETLLKAEKERAEYWDKMVRESGIG
jgi:hypothetical protein